jgi:sec-independent protein translocase protein TatC
MSRNDSADELAGTEQPFVQHLVELRDRLLYCLYGLITGLALLAVWPGPSRLIDWVALPIRAHMPVDAKLIAVGVFSPFFVPLKVLMMAAFLLALPWLMYQMWAFVAPGLYQHEKRFALPLIVLGSGLAYLGIAFVQFLVLDKMFAFIQAFAPASVAATPDVASYVEAILSLYLAFALAFQVPVQHGHPRKAAPVSRVLHRGGICDCCHRHPTRCHLAVVFGRAHVLALRSGSLGGSVG